MSFISDKWSVLNMTDLPAQWSLTLGFVYSTGFLNEPNVFDYYVRWDSSTLTVWLKKKFSFNTNEQHFHILEQNTCFYLVFEKARIVSWEGCNL